jgi:hypothetical protein
MRIVICVALAVSVCACGGKKSTDPTDGVLKNGCFAVPNNVGNIKATISGLPSYSGIVQKGGAFSSPATGSTPGVVTVGAVDLNDGTQVIVNGPNRIGTTTASVNVADPAAAGISISVITVKSDCSGPTGNWIASAVQGSATFTLTTSTSTTVTGSFTGTVIPGGSGATGNKTISGTFTASL